VPIPWIPITLISGEDKENANINKYLLLLSTPVNTPKSKVELGFYLMVDDLFYYLLLKVGKTPK